MKRKKQSQFGIVLEVALVLFREQKFVLISALQILFIIVLLYLNALTTDYYVSVYEAIYYVLNMMTGIGEGEYTPNSNLGYLYTIFGIILNWGGYLLITYFLINKYFNRAKESLQLKSKNEARINTKEENYLIYKDKSLDMVRRYTNRFMEANLKELLIKQAYLLEKGTNEYKIKFQLENHNLSIIGKRGEDGSLDVFESLSLEPYQSEEIWKALTPNCTIIEKDRYEVKLSGEREIKLDYWKINSKREFIILRISSPERISQDLLEYINELKSDNMIVGTVNIPSDKLSAKTYDEVKALTT